MYATQDAITEVMILVKEGAKTHDLNGLVQVSSSFFIFFLSVRFDFLALVTRRSGVTTQRF